MIEYSVTDILKEIFRKWYIVVIGMLVLGGLSLPISERSFSVAQTEYNMAMTNTEAYVSSTIFYNVDCKSIDDIKIFVDCLKNVKYVSEISSNWDLDYAAIASKIEANIIDENILRIDLAKMEEGKYELVKEVILNLGKQLSKQGFEIKVEENFELQYKEPLDNIYEILYEKPSKKQNTIKIVGTAMALGCIVSMFGIMFWDYRKKVRLYYNN